MTFSILGYCPRNDQVGIGFTTVTLAGGGISPFVSYGGDIVVVQAYGNPLTALAGARVLDAGGSLEEVRETMSAADPAFDYRQVGVMRRDGGCFALTGERARPWAGHEVGPEFVAMGNVLVGPAVVSAMAAAFTTEPKRPLGDRLLAAIEAGRDAGGQQAPDGGHYDERSMLLRVIGDGPDRREVTAFDLRVDMKSDAVARMREIYEIYRPVVKRRSERARNPAVDAPTSVWEAEHMTERPPPPALKVS